MSAFDRPFSLESNRLTDGLFWLLGITVALHVLKALLVGVGAVTEAEIHGLLGASPDGLRSFRLWQPLTAMFVHGGVAHLLWNMLVLFFAGRYLEPRIGTRAFCGVYILGGVIGSLACWIPLSSDLPLIGAGGGVLAVLLALAVVAPEAPVYAVLLTLRMKWVVTLLFAIDLGLAFGASGQSVWAGDSWRTAYWTHALGGITGVAWTWGWPQLMLPRIEARRSRRARRREIDQLEQELMDERELDRILDKISREGLPSLTDPERRFLERTSNRYQNSRGP